MLQENGWKWSETSRVNYGIHIIYFFNADLHDNDNVPLPHLCLKFLPVAAERVALFLDPTPHSLIPRASGQKVHS